MKLRTLGYHLGQALANIERNGWASVVSVIIIAISLVILGGFTLAIANLQHIAANVESQLEIVAFLDDLSKAEQQALAQAIKAIPGVSEVVFVSRDEGLARLKENFRDHQEVFAELERNPLPDSYRIHLLDASQVQTVATKLEGLAGIDKVNYGKGWVDKLLALTRGLWILTILAVVGLGIAVVLIIINTIRLAVFARRKEIEIMKLVGATDWFIRAPFLSEGILLGFFGGLIANIVLYILYTVVMNRVDHLLPFLPLIKEGPVVVNICLFLVVLGVAIGALGSSISVKKFLRV